MNIASFDVEEHHRIEAAAGLVIGPELKAEYGTRMEAATRRIVGQLAAANAKATFYIVGEIARSHPRLVRDIADAGHEIGSHSWDHRMVNRFTPAEFREDLLKSKAALEDASGQRVVGFRAPTFSISRRTPWAIDALVECGFEYDSSIFPVRHDRYGIPDAPRGPFWAKGESHAILELPPLTYRLAGMNLPVAGGGYFRLFPLAVMKAGLRQVSRSTPPNDLGMLYFHPWEFDPDQPRLPLKKVSRWRTYVGMKKTTRRLGTLLKAFPFARAIDAVKAIRDSNAELPAFQL